MFISSATCRQCLRTCRKNLTRSYAVHVLITTWYNSSNASQFANAVFSSRQTTQRPAGHIISHTAVTTPTPRSRSAQACTLFHRPQTLPLLASILPTCCAFKATLTTLRAYLTKHTRRSKHPVQPTFSFTYTSVTSPVSTKPACRSYPLCPGNKLINSNDT